ASYSCPCWFHDPCGLGLSAGVGDLGSELPAVAAVPVSAFGCGVVGSVASVEGDVSDVVRCAFGDDVAVAPTLHVFASGPCEADLGSDEPACLPPFGVAVLLGHDARLASAFATPD